MTRLKLTKEKPDLLSLLFPILPVREFRFHPVRQWRFDYAWPSMKIALEKEGAVWVQGRHTRGSGFVKDMEKYNEAALLGWRVFRFTPKQLETGEAQLFMKKVLA